MTKARKHHTWPQTTWKCWLLEIQRYRYSHTTPRCNDTGEHYRDNNKYYVHTSRVASTIWRKAFSILTSCYRVENRFSSALYTQQCRLKRISLTKEIENSEIEFLRLSQSWLRFLHKWEHWICNRIEFSTKLNYLDLHCRKTGSFCPNSAIIFFLE